MMNWAYVHLVQQYKADVSAAVMISRLVHQFREHLVVISFDIVIALKMKIPSY